LIEQDGGGGWAIISSPDPSGSSSSQLNAVTCASATKRWAVGDSSARGGGGSTLIEQNTGSGWSIVPSANPSAGGFNELDGVTCVTADDCWAVGEDSGGVGNNGPLVEQETAGTWTVVSPPTPSGDTLAVFHGATCVGAGQCWIVGDTTSAAALDQSLLEENTGDGWTLVSTPTPPNGTSSELEAVTCASAADCWAVGSFDDEGNQTLIEEGQQSGT
jgi:hypothetical protein